MAGLSCLAGGLTTPATHLTDYVNNLTGTQKSKAETIATSRRFVSSPAMKHSTLNVGASAESVKLTVKYEYSDDKNWYDRLILFVIIDENKNYFTLDKDQIVEYPGQSFDIDIPKGKYYGLMLFETDTPECHGLFKLVLMDETEITEDKTVMFDGKTATHRISQEYILPNGEKPNLVDFTGDGSYEGGNCDGGAMVMLRVLDLDMWSGVFFFLECDLEELMGNDRVHCTDFFTNKATDKFDIYTAMYLQPIDLEKQEWSKDIPLVISSRAVPITASDVTYKQEVSDLVKFTPSAFTRSKAEGDPFPYGTCEYNIRYMQPDGGWSFSTGLCSQLQDGAITTVLDDNAPVLFDICSDEIYYWDNTTVYEGLGIVTPKFLVKRDGSADYIMNDNIYTRMSFDEIVRVNFNYDKQLEGHPFYNFNSYENTPEFGNSAPILSFPVCQSHPSNGTAFLFPSDWSIPTWVGNFGERRSVDKYNMSFTVKAGDETIISNWEEFPWPLFDHAMPQHDPHEVSLIFDNSNFEVCGLQGNTRAEIKYLEKAEGDINSPSVQMMQFRDKNNKISNRFDNADDATINISYGDFYYQYDKDDRRFVVSDCDVKVEVAPYGTENYTEIATEQIPELFKMPCWGYFRTGKLTGLGASPNGWWNVRLTLRDDSSNSTVQTISPAFYAANTDQSGLEDITVSEDNDENAVYYNLQGIHTDNPANGIYIRVSGGESRKVMVK